MMKKPINPYKDIVCPIFGKEIVTNPAWDVHIESYTVFFGVLDKRVVVMKSQGRSSEESSRIFEIKFQQLIKEAIEPNSTYATCDNSIDFKSTTNQGRALYVENCKKKHPHLKGVNFYNIGGQLRFLVRIAKSLYRVPFEIRSDDSYKLSVQNAYRQVGLPVPIEQNNCDGKDYITKDEWSYVSGESSFEFRIYDKNILYYCFNEKPSYEIIDKVFETYYEVLKYIEISTGSKVYRVISDLLLFHKESIVKRQYFIKKLSALNKIYPRDLAVIVGAGFFAKQIMTISTLYISKKTQTADTLVKALELARKHKKKSKTLKRLEGNSLIDQMNEYVASISWGEDGIKINNDFKATSQMQPFMESISMLLEDIDDLFKERLAKETELQKLATELKKSNELLEERVNERTKELIIAKDLAEDASRVQGEFLAKISHEFRTPMHGILSFSNFGIKKAAKVPVDRLVYYFESIKDSGVRLMSLVDNLLDFTKLEQKKMPFIKGRHDLELCIKAVASQLSLLLEENGHEINIHDNAFGCIECDQDRMMQVFTNIIGNAVKFAGRGSLIDVFFREHAIDNKKFLAIEFINNGEPIPNDDLKRIFEIFHQTSGAHMEYGGAGLGLAICREILDAHEGHIHALNRPEGGVSFTIELPMD